MFAYGRKAPQSQVVNKSGNNVQQPVKKSKPLSKTSAHIRSSSATSSQRIWNRNSKTSTKQIPNKNIPNKEIPNKNIPNKEIPNKEIPKLPDPVEIPLVNSSEIAIQTNEDEIMNHALVVGDLKIMKPSKSVVEEIDKFRQQLEIQKLLKATRKFEEHSAKDEKHLNDLNEFLEKSYVSKKEPKVQENLFEKDRKLMSSMDEILNREIPKTESITNIKARIKRKEQELLRLFDHA